MKRRINLLVVLLVALSSIASSSAQIVTYTWTGAANSNYWNETANWLNGVTPQEDLVNIRVLFGNVPKTYVSYSEIFVNRLTFSGNTRPYYLQGYADTTHIGDGGIVYSPGAAVKSAISGSVQLEASQTWNIANGTFVVEDEIGDYYTNESFSYVSHNYQITKTGAGTLVLGNTYSNYWGGGLVLSQGKVVISPEYDSTDYSLGTGTLTFNGGTLVTTEDNSYGDPVYLQNNLVSNGLISTQNETELHIGYSGEGNSTIELTANTTIQSQGRPLFLEGNIIQTGGEAGTPRSLNVTGSGAVILTGSNSYTGGTTVTDGVLIFGNAYAIPSNNLDSSSVGHLTAGTNGYIGFGDSSYTNSVQSYFIADFDKTNTSGTIGFDSDPEGSTNTFTDSIDLTGFAATVRLGSATSAILSGTITPQGTAFRFGGGGGKLEVQSALTDAAGPVVRNVVLDSPAELPLTVRFTSTGNTFTGGVSATQSAAIFGTGALPATGSFTLGTGGYIGVNDIGQGSGLSQAFINRFATTTDRGMIGFDAASEPVPITDNISLAGFSDASPGIYLGTASRAVFDATSVITPQGSIYRFAAYKGGQLTVNSILSGVGNSVHIGDPSSLGTMGDYQQEQYSTVRLAGNNTYGGTTTLYTGRLDLGHANALGTGALIVQPHSLSLPAGEEDVRPELRVDSGLTIANALDLNADLNIGGSGSTFTLSGTVSGAGELYLDGDYTHLTLSGNNSAFSGGIYLSGYNNALTLGSNNAAGTGPLGFGYTSSATVYFNTTAPVVGGLASKEEGDYAALYATQADTILTINQTFDSGFAGEFRSSHANDSVRFVKNGSNTLWLKSGGLYYHNGVVNADLAGAEIGLQVNQGTLVLGNSLTIEDITPTVWVHGGTLALENRSLMNPLVIDNGGRIAGTGSFSAATIGTGAILSPGSAMGGQIGFLDFASNLTLAPGGTYEWNLANPGTFISDTIHASGATNPLVITATSANKFTLRAITLGTDGNPGILAGVIVPNATYSWMLMSAMSITPNGAGFDPNAFTLDVSQFQTDIGTGLALGTFSVSLANGDTQLMLNLTTFAGIPEPSTYALMVLGLGFIGLTAWRKRRV